MMPNQFLDQPPHKEDEESTTSLDDSTYMSQPDTGRRNVKPMNNMPFQHAQGSRTQIMDHYQASFTYSPSLSTDSQGNYRNTDMNQMLLPPAAEQSEMIDDNFSNFVTSQQRATPSTLQCFYSADDVSDLGERWSNNNMQMFSQPFAVSPVDATAYLAQGQQPLFPSYSDPSYEVYSDQTRRGHLPSNTTTSTLPTTMRRSISAATPKNDLYNSYRKASFAGAQTPRFENQVLSPATSIVSSHHQTSRMDRDIQVDTQSLRSETGERSTIQSIHIVSDDADDQYFEASAAAHPSSEEAEIRLARAHPLYQAATKADELYHCPYEGEAGCGHKPTKLKCNYEYVVIENRREAMLTTLFSKYVDSHLKPFRCKVTDCIDVQFSSTACLLRHEREAHGMHGHGSKPHLCLYSDCDRAIPGNGFPRRYNLFDHMKRVHDYTGPTSPIEESTPPLPGGVPKKPASRKRKAGAVEQPSEQQPRKASTSTRPSITMRPPQTNAQREARRLKEQWRVQREKILELLQTVQAPEDMVGHDILADVAALQKSANQIADLG